MVRVRFLDRMGGQRRYAGTYLDHLQLSRIGPDIENS